MSNRILTQIYVRILYHHHLNVTYPSIIMWNVKCINEII